MDDMLPVPRAIEEIERQIAAGDLDDAVDAADALVGRVRTDATLRVLAKALFERGTATYDEAEYDDALGTMGEAIGAAEHDRARADLLAERATMQTGGVFVTAERETQAAQDMRDAYALDPTNASVLMGMALMRSHPAIHAGRPQAIVWVEEAIAQAQMECKEEWWHWSALAHLLEEEGETNRAADAYGRMLDLFPFGTGHPLEFVMRQQRKHLQVLRGERLAVFDAGSLIQFDDPPKPPQGT